MVQILEQSNVQHAHLVHPHGVSSRPALSDVLPDKMITSVATGHQRRVVWLRDDDNVPAPTYDPNLNAQERAELRAARAAAAEQRMKQAGISQPKKKPKPSSSEPLRGPNSQNMMRWTSSS